MDTQAKVQSQALSEEIERLVRERVDAYLREKEEEKAQRTPRLALIVTKGTLDWAYPPLILATTAAALGWDVGMFFTFYGLNIIHKKKGKHLKVAPLANPAMPMPVPNIIGAIPGMTAMGTMVMKSMFKSHHVSTIDELIEMAVESGVKLWPCGMTMDVFGYKPDDFIEGIQEICGATHFIVYAKDADVSLFT
ncbi:MAG TPA: DsrE/DsrF/DrsH-like family protein [Ktedonobacteraceae bacterium]|nr:DsrE/DsrF/DrsH-like family protein [Ktedonobacteraceae bacterium]